MDDLSIHTTEKILSIWMKRPPNAWGVGWRTIRQLTLLGARDKNPT